MPVLILGKGKLSREDSWDVRKESGIRPGRKEECWWGAAGGGFASVGGCWKGLLLCQGVELLHPISHVSMGECTESPCSYSPPSLATATAASARGGIFVCTCVTTEMGHGLQEIDQQARVKALY